MSDLSSGFQAGFSARHDTAAQILHQAFSLPEDNGFTPADIKARAASRGPVGFAPQAARPRHFTPADPDANPTAGWDPFEPSAAQEFADPIATAHATGYAEGVAAANAEAGAIGERDRAFLKELATAMAKDRFDRDRMARLLRQTVLLLVTRLVGETEIAPDLLTRRITAAIDLLADSAESALLRIHPDDVALLADVLPKTIFAVGDDAIARGSFVLESASTIVEDGPDMWLEQLAAAIEHVAVPPAC